MNGSLGSCGGGPVSARRLSGFTLLEILIVVAILGILTAVAAPNYLRYRLHAHASACLSNLYALERAIELYKINGESDEPSMAVLCEPIGYLKGEPRCPADKSEPYDLSGNVPTCPNVDDFPTHQITSDDQ